MSSLEMSNNVTVHENPGAPSEYINGIKKIGSLASMKK